MLHSILAQPPEMVQIPVSIVVGLCVAGLGSLVGLAALITSRTNTLSIIINSQNTYTQKLEARLDKLELDHVTDQHCISEQSERIAHLEAQHTADQQRIAYLEAAHDDDQAIIAAMQKRLGDMERKNVTLADENEHFRSAMLAQTKP